MVGDREWEGMAEGGKETEGVGERGRTRKVREGGGTEEEEGRGEE